VPNLLVDSVTVMQPIPVSFMRSVGSTSTVFFLESFVNELAHTVRADPVRYRRALLKHDPLALRVLDATAARANWFGRAPAGVSRGVAYSLYTGRGGAFRTYVAAIADVRVTGGQVKLERIVCGIDCGRAINPLLIREMVEGGVGFALTNTFRSEITFEHGAVVQRNFADYPLLGLAAMPTIDVVIVDSDRDPQGCGEVALPPVAPAVADAIWRATGERPRSMPFATPLAT